MDVDDLCTGCMAERQGAAVCPACGWDEDAAEVNPLMLAPRSVLAGQYLVGRHLGHGGFGIVYLAWDLNLHLKLAIKEFMPDRHATRSADRTSVVPFSGASREFFEYGLTQFLDEGRRIARFNDHPGIVPVLNFFRENGTGYLVMSYVPGLTLEEHQRSRGGRLPWQEAIAIAMPVMDTLRAVHEGKLLHRDISPDNIYIAHSKQVKLLDFGAARQDFGNKSKSLILKTGFAPKEQYQTRGNQGPWTDVYALGATLYCLITGETPPESLERNEHDRLLPPSALGIALPPAVEQALLKALAINPESRFQTMAEMQEALGPSSASRDERRQRDRTLPGPAPGPAPGPRPGPTPAPGPEPMPAPQPDLAESAAALLLRPAQTVERLLTGLHAGLSPAPDRHAALRQPAIVVTAIVGVLGLLWSFSIVTINANPYMLMAAPAIVGMALLTGVVALLGNAILLFAAYLAFKGDGRGPVIAWATAWTLVLYGFVSFAWTAVNLARVADASVLPYMLSPAFSAVAWGTLQLGAILFLFWKRRP